jgi:nitrogen fixation protein FixH
MSFAEVRPFSGRKFLAILIAAFVVVGAVNGLMIWYALSTWSGLVSDSAFQEGLGFDRVLAESRAEAALGWRADIGFEREGKLTVTLADASAKPLAGMQISASFLRPTREGFDSKATLTEAAPGRYEAIVHLPLPGQWDIRVTVKADGQVRFHAERRIVVAE